MSNQLANSYQNFTDKQLQNMSSDEIKQIVSQEKKGLKKDLNELEKKRKLIKKYRKLQEFRQKVKKGKVIKTKPQVVSTSHSKKIKTKPQVVSKTHSKKIKTFEDYFEECIKNKSIPKDTPSRTKPNTILNIFLIYF